jgi:hypothetical protein
MAIIGLLRPLIADIRRQGGLGRMASSFQLPRFQITQIFTIFFIAAIASLVIVAVPWHFSAKLVPIVVGTIALIAAGLSLFNEMCRKPVVAGAEGLGDKAQHEIGEAIHMDLTSDTGHLPTRVIATRALRFFAYLLAFMGSMAVIGLIPTVAVFVVVFMRLEGQERWQLVLTYAAVLLVGIYVAFDVFMAVPWPPSLLGQFFPALKIIPSV